MIQRQRRVTSGKCEGAAFVFGLIESAIRKEATEILLTPVQELEMVRMDFGETVSRRDTVRERQNGVILS